jgi:hypothetical protein
MGEARPDVKAMDGCAGLAARGADLSPRKIPCIWPFCREFCQGRPQFAAVRWERLEFHQRLKPLLPWVTSQGISLRCAVNPGPISRESADSRSPTRDRSKSARRRSVARAGAAPAGPLGLTRKMLQVARQLVPVIAGEERIKSDQIAIRGSCNPAQLRPPSRSRQQC